MRTTNVHIFCQEYSRDYRRHVDEDPIRSLNGPRSVRSSLRSRRDLIFDIPDLILLEDVLSNVLTRDGLTSRILLASHRRIPEDTDDGIGTAKAAINPVLLRVAVRREEGGQVESWVSESVGGAEHA